MLLICGWSFGPSPSESPTQQQRIRGDETQCTHIRYVWIHTHRYIHRCTHTGHEWGWDSHGVISDVSSTPGRKTERKKHSRGGQGQPQPQEHQGGKDITGRRSKKWRTGTEKEREKERERETHTRIHTHSSFANPFREPFVIPNTINMRQWDKNHVKERWRYRRK